MHTTHLLVEQSPGVPGLVGLRVQLRGQLQVLQDQLPPALVGAAVLLQLLLPLPWEWPGTVSKPRKKHHQKHHLTWLYQLAARKGGQLYKGRWGGLQSRGGGQPPSVTSTALLNLDRAGVLLWLGWAKQPLPAGGLEPNSIAMGSHTRNLVLARQRTAPQHGTPSVR